MSHGISRLIQPNFNLILCFKVSGGREGRPIGAYELAKAVEELGAGEILLNCIDCDGTMFMSLTYIYSTFEVVLEWV